MDEVMHKSAMIQQSILLHGEATLFEHDHDPYMLEVTRGQVLSACLVCLACAEPLTLWLSLQVCAEQVDAES